MAALRSSYVLLSLAGGAVRLSPLVSAETQAMPAALTGYAAIILPGFFAVDPASLLGAVQTARRPVIERLRAVPDETLLAASCYGVRAGRERAARRRRGDDDVVVPGRFRQRYPRVRLDADRAVADGEALHHGRGDDRAHRPRAARAAPPVWRGAGAADRGHHADRWCTDVAASVHDAAPAFDDPLIQRATDWLAARAGETFPPRRWPMRCT